MASVLVADDEDTLRQSLCELLVDFGFRVVGEAANGSEAVKLSRQLLPDIALLDLRMPVLDGIGAARMIKEQIPSTQVVILTAYDDESLRDEAHQAGVYCYLVKGCSPGLMRDILTRASAWGASRRRGHDSSTPRRPDKVVDRQPVTRSAREDPCPGRSLPPPAF
jgi:DNA-binding NarL/FixJ family response regulator